MIKKKKFSEDLQIRFQGMRNLEFDDFPKNKFTFYKSKYIFSKLKIIEKSKEIYAILITFY